MTRESLETQIATILSPAIDARAPYAKHMIGAIVDLIGPPDRTPVARKQLLLELRAEAATREIMAAKTDDEITKSGEEHVARLLRLAASFIDTK